MTRHRSRRADIRQGGRLCHTGKRLRLAHARFGNMQVRAVAQGGGDQGIQLRITIGMPPLLLRPLGGIVDSRLRNDRTAAQRIRIDAL
ncbi:hypothetical protein D3C81_1895950 [compost metagenome]